MGLEIQLIKQTEKIEKQKRQFDYPLISARTKVSLQSLHVKEIYSGLGLLAN